MITRIVLIRHGETDWNAEKRWQGRAPIPLNATGLSQAAQLARYFAAHGPDLSAFYSSPLPRAMQTAQVIADAINMSILSDPRLVEIDLGDWQGLTREEIESWDQERYVAYSATWPDTAVPNGESWHAVRARARAAFDDLAGRHSGRTIALMSHGGTIGQVIASLFGGIERPSLTNTSITLIERATSDAAWNLARVAWTPHLDNPDSLGETW